MFKIEQEKYQCADIGKLKVSSELALMYQKRSGEDSPHR